MGRRPDGYHTPRDRGESAGAPGDGACGRPGRDGGPRDQESGPRDQDGEPRDQDGEPRDRQGGPRDEVDELVAQWRAERPDLDVQPLQVLSRISRLARHLDRERTAAFAAHGLQAWEFDVLSALRRQGPPYQLSPRALLRATLVTSGTMTNRIDRLEAAGLVSRRPDPADKRGVLAALTDRGRAAADAALADLLTSERALLTGLDDSQQRDLAALLRILLAPFDAEQAPDG
jgi:DNA-binding MarR family transcriptional regulator